jgi:hypothetical protein
MPELTQPDFSTWLGIPLSAVDKEQDHFQAETSDGVKLVELHLYGDFRFQGKRYPEAWTAKIKVKDIEGTGLKPGRAEARASAERLLLKVSTKLEAGSLSPALTDLLSKIQCPPETQHA